jgi:hypothetical protein
MGKEDEVSKISVGKFTVGIVGLKEALEKAAEGGLPADDAAAQHLLNRLKPRNYIPSGSELEYARAFLREYRKYRGMPVEVEKSEGLDVKILGAGCVNCDKLEQMVYRVMTGANLVGNVEHVRDLQAIVSYGIASTPALVINRQINCAGRLPVEKQMLQWLNEATGE